MSPLAEGGTIEINGGDEWALVGERMRSARKTQGLSMRELARRIEVSASHVSQVERGMASFSVRSLYRVASVLGVSMDSLFEHDDGATATPASDVRPAANTILEDAGIVQRAGLRATITLHSGPRWERLTARPEATCEFIEVIYAPAVVDAQPPTDFVRHDGREYGIVTRGSLKVEVGFDIAVLAEGDSIAVDSSVPHRYWNSTTGEVRAIWFISDRHHDLANPSGPASANTTSNRHAH